jgi:hypothetical protein
MSKNKGWFKVSSVFFDGVKPGFGVGLFNNMIVLEATARHYQGYTEYLAIHPDFALINEGQVIPEYTATFTADSVYPKWQAL